MRIKLPSAKSHWVFKLWIYLSTDKVFKSLIAKLGWIFMMIFEWLRFSYRVILFKSWIANMAGFLLWLSITNIIEVFKVALAQRLLFLPMGMIYFTMEEIVPSRCRLTTRHLRATLFKSRLQRIYKSHVTASMHHGTWGLMQSHSFWLNLLKTRLITF